ncbi:hypothetical protein B0H14DRAFT_3887024 [Mycena olivaceomarginata]|nr:hypothetical protein B0H14DRAFT_3887024 [Mycena olivaceomarginata]
MSSPFASRLGTNYSAQDKEIDEIKALLVEPSQKLKRLNDEIDVMRKALDKFVEERDILSTYVDAHRALISPVRRLHLDILEAIFIACLPTHRNCVMSAQEAPVILGRICSSWRAISLKTPRLWSRLHIVEPNYPNYPYNSPLGVYQSKVEQRLKVANAWLRRSKMCPLSISLESSFDYMGLETHVDVERPSFPGHPYPIRLAVAGYLFGGIFIRHADVITPGRERGALNSELDLVVECPFLHTFDLSCDGIPLYVADRLLGRLALPQLRDFKLRLRGARLGATEELYSTFSADSVLSFLTTLTRLESISADSAMFPKPILINFLRALPPTVLCLAITQPMWLRLNREDAIFDDEVLEALTTFPDRPNHCPVLQEVVIHYCPKLSDKALLRFIMSRPTLKLVDIKFDRERKVDILPSLQPFTEAGLKTSITYSALPFPQFSPWQGLPDVPLTLWGSP